MDQDLPSFSIVVPTYNRPHQLRSICLPALAQLDYPAHLLEAIVVDDGGKTSLGGVVEEFAARLPIILLRQAHSGPAAARNTGAKIARGRFLAFTDDDCAPDSTWLLALARRFAATADCAIGGRTINALVENPYSATSQLVIDYLYDHASQDSNKMRFFTSNNLAVPADQFRSMGGFNETFSIGGEDRELCYRWVQHGFELSYSPEAVVYHWHHMSLRSFTRQHFRYGVGAFTFRKIIADTKMASMQIERPGFYLDLLRCALFPKNKQKTIWYTVLIWISQLATAIGYSWRWASFQRKTLN